MFDWPKDQTLRLPGLKTEVAAAYVMGNPACKIAVSRRRSELGEETVLRLPTQPTDPVASVMVVELKGPAVVEPLVIRPDAKGQVRLPADFAEIRAVHGQRAKPVSQGGRAYIGNWSNPNDVVAWSFTLPSSGSFAVAVDGRPASPKAAGKRVRVSLGKQQLLGKISDKGVDLEGLLKIPAGQQTITVTLPDADRTGPPVLDLFGVTLVPAAVSP